MTILRISGRLLRRGLGGTLLLLLGIVLFELVNPVIGTSIGGADVVQGLFDQLPPGMRAITQVQPDFFIKSGFAGFVALGYTHPVFFVLVSSAVVGFGARTLAGEVESGILALTLSRPVSRSEVFLSRVLDLGLLALGLAAAGVLGTWLGILIADAPSTLPARAYAALLGASWLLAWSIGGLVLGASAASSTTGRVVGWATGVLVIFYFIDYFAELWSPLEPFGPFSIFRYYDPVAALVDGRIPLVNAVVLGGVGLVGVVIGLSVFQRRDLAI